MLHLFVIGLALQDFLNGVQWVVSHKAALFGVVTSVIGTATLIVKMTPTQKDDNVLAKLMAFVSKFIALNDEKHVDALDEAKK